MIEKNVFELMRLLEFCLVEKLAQVRSFQATPRQKGKNIVEFAENLKKTRSQLSTESNNKYWSKMTPEQRSAEVKRRFEVGQKTKKKKARAAEREKVNGQSMGVPS